MNDKLVQDWLDGNTSERPSDADLLVYQRLYQVLSEEPSMRLSEGFAARVTERLSQIETDSSVDRIVNYLSLLGAAAGFVLLMLYSAQFVAVDTTPLTNLLGSITIVTELISPTWLYTALVCGLIGLLDNNVLPRFIKQH